MAAPAFPGLPAWQHLRHDTDAACAAGELGATPSNWLAIGKALGEGTVTHTMQRARKKPLEVQVLMRTSSAPKHRV